MVNYIFPRHAYFQYICQSIVLVFSIYFIDSIFVQCICLIIFFRCNVYCKQYPHYHHNDTTPSSISNTAANTITTFTRFEVSPNYHVIMLIYFLLEFSIVKLILLLDVKSQSVFHTIFCSLVWDSP